MLSRRSVARPWINFEAGAAWLSRTPVIPVCFGGVKVGSLPKPYSDFQGLELPDGAYYLFASVLHHVAPSALALPPIAAWDVELVGIRQSLDFRTTHFAETHEPV
jgi:hypothetical protein